MCSSDLAGSAVAYTESPGGRVDGLTNGQSYYPATLAEQGNRAWLTASAADASAVSKAGDDAYSSGVTVGGVTYRGYDTALAYYRTADMDVSDARFSVNGNAYSLASVDTAGRKLLFTTGLGSVSNGAVVRLTTDSANHVAQLDKVTTYYLRRDPGNANAALLFTSLAEIGRAHV